MNNIGCSGKISCGKIIICLIREIDRKILAYDIGIVRSNFSDDITGDDDFRDIRNAIRDSAVNCL